METHYLGHVVFCVKGLQRALGFYRDFSGFRKRVESLIGPRTIREDKTTVAEGPVGPPRASWSGSLGRRLVCQAPVMHRLYDGFET